MAHLHHTPAALPGCAMAPDHGSLEQSCRLLSVAEFPSPGRRSAGLAASDQRRSGVTEAFHSVGRLSPLWTRSVNGGKSALFAARPGKCQRKELLPGRPKHQQCSLYPDQYLKPDHHQTRRRDHGPPLSSYLLPQRR
ncbi:hypothetical protein JZ751_025800 [Albula glossodonta]|uniref:Uncharacterized protein n=1 Tax=Albula glossodonta TaxID=121402 RepID=A0A8T2NF64_9TELE|nr:hypothetical protein JZ751_025800 [Albula glossodonta]